MKWCVLTLLTPHSKPQHISRISFRGFCKHLTVYRILRMVFSNSRRYFHDCPRVGTFQFFHFVFFISLNCESLTYRRVKVNFNQIQILNIEPLKCHISDQTFENQKLYFTINSLFGMSVCASFISANYIWIQFSWIMLQIIIHNTCRHPKWRGAITT